MAAAARRVPLLSSMWFLWMLGALPGAASMSTSPMTDGRVVTPDRYEAQWWVDRADEDEEEELSDVSEEDRATNSSCPSTPCMTEDYMARLQPDSPGPDVAGILERVVVTCGDLWEDGRHVLAGAIALRLVQWNPEEMTEAQAMMVEALRRYL